MGSFRKNSGGETGGGASVRQTGVLPLSELHGEGVESEIREGQVVGTEETIWVSCR